MNAAISILNVSKTYKSAGQTVSALQNISLEIPYGQIFGLLGPNGAGKTTLISILAGLVISDSGKITILGLDRLST